MLPQKFCLIRISIKFSKLGMTSLNNLMTERFEDNQKNHEKLRMAGYVHRA